MSSSLVVGLLRRDDSADGSGGCPTGNDFNGSLGVRISALFVILVTSTFGALFPVIARNNAGMKMPTWTFFIAKYFGSGVIVATAFIHLLSPANDALSNPCLTGPITGYPFAEGIALMSVFSLFLIELLALRYATFSGLSSAIEQESSATTTTTASSDDGKAENLDLDRLPVDQAESDPGESYAGQLTALFILEFGVILHSLFIGLTLAVSGDEFKTLYIVLTFHQMFEGLGLGARLSALQWPRSKRFTPHMMAIAFGLSTPLAIGIGLGVRNTYPPGSQTTLIANGVFDSISAGILLYTGLVELIAHEFLFNKTLKEESTLVVFGAFGYMVLGAGIMALLGKWA